jgi:hypothetical protein
LFELIEIGRILRSGRSRLGTGAVGPAVRTTCSLGQRRIWLRPALEEGQARFVPHAAFQDPSASPSAAPRESIELRCLVFS